MDRSVCSRAISSYPSAYFHVPINPKHRKFLHFSVKSIFSSTIYFWIIIWLLILSPNTWKLHWSHYAREESGCYFIWRSDCDGILQGELSTSRSGACEVSFEVGHCPKMKNRALLSLPRWWFIWKSTRLSPARLEALNTLLSGASIRRVVSNLLVVYLLGMMSASHAVVPLGLLHMKIQRWFWQLFLDQRHAC